MITLKNWSIVGRSSSPFKAIELGRVCFSGEVYNDDRFRDGSKIYTGSIVFFDADLMIGRTKRTEYSLEDMNESFEEYLEENCISLEEYMVDKEIALEN